MSSVPAELVNRTSFRPSFYFWIAFVMAVYVFGGFSLAALQRYLTNDATTMPPVVHLHGVTFISWMTLLMVQTWLINVKNVPLHRSLGTFGIALGTAVLFTGMLITALRMSSGPPTAPFYYDLFYLSLAALGGFGILFTLAIRHVRDPENHRRLILFATIPLLPPGINRTYQVLGQLDSRLFPPTAPHRPTHESRVVRFPLVPRRGDALAVRRGLRHPTRSAR
jgi:hypothetical protein